MKIALVSERASPLAVPGGKPAGGQSVYVAALAGGLARRGHDVTVYTRRDAPGPPPTVHRDGYVIAHVPVGPAAPVGPDRLAGLTPQFGDWLTRRWQRDRPDLIHAHYWMSGLAALRAAEKVHVPVAQTFHAFGSTERKYLGSRDPSPIFRIEAERLVASSADMVIATCRTQVRELARYGVPRDRIVIVPCGVDVGLFRRSRQEAGADPAAPTGPRLVYLGGLAPRNGIDTIIQALVHIPDAEFVIVGGPEKPRLARDQDARRLRAAADKCGVAERVHFTGRIGHDKVPGVLRSATAVLSVPWYEPLGIVPLEAMAAGTVIVASAVGGHLDIIEHGRNGLLVPPRDPRALTAALREVIERPLLRVALGHAGLRHVRARYGWDRIVADTEAVYRRVVQARGEPRPAGAAM